MPSHFFGGFGDVGVQLDYATSVKADVSKQNYTVCPRHWYIDAMMRCEQCHQAFLFSAAEQHRWYEEFGFYVDSRPRHCLNCRCHRRTLKSLRQEYDQRIASALTANDAEIKARIIDIIDQLCEAGEDLPARMHEKRKQLAGQMVQAR